MAGLPQIQNGESSELAAKSKIDNLLLEMSSLTPSERDKLIKLIQQNTVELKDDTVTSVKANPTVVEANPAIVKEPDAWYEKPWYESQTAKSSLLFLVPLYFFGAFIYIYSDYNYPKMSLFFDNHPWIAAPIFFSILIYLSLLQLIVTCVFICLEKFCNKYILMYALINLPPIIARILAHIAAHIHPDPFCHSFLIFAYNGVLFYVCVRKPLYSYVGGISVIIGVFFFYMGQGLYEIPLIVYMLHNAFYKFSFMIFSEQHYERNYRFVHGHVMIFFLVLLLIIHGRKPFEVWEMIPMKNLTGRW